MKKLLSIKYSNSAFNLSVLLLRVVLGFAMLLNHGLPKLMDFSARATKFYDFMGMGAKTSLILAIFAEVFCSMFLILGLFTRLALVPLIITTVVIVFLVDKGKPFMDSELALLFLFGYISLMLLGPGRVSVDGMISK